MNLLTPNSPYYHLPKDLLFLLKHPVCMYVCIYILLIIEHNGDVSAENYN